MASDITVSELMTSDFMTSDFMTSDSTTTESARTAEWNVMQTIADADPARGARRFARSVAGLDGFDGFQGRLKCGRALAIMRIESGDWIRVHLHLGPPPLPPLEALAAGALLPGNVRFAFSGGASYLVGDSRLDGMDHLPASLGEIRRALSRKGRVPSSGRGSPSGPGPHWTGPVWDGPAIDEGKVQAILDDLPFGEGAVVRLEDGWELRPRLGGEPQPLRATIDGGGLRLHRALPWDRPEGPAAEAVALEALRINGDLRLARLALGDDGLVVETRLHAGLLDAQWVAFATRAVCHAYRHALLPLGVLHADPRVAAAYLRLQEPEDSTRATSAGRTSAHERTPTRLERR